MGGCMVWWVGGWLGGLMRIIGHKLSFSTVLLHNPKPIHVCNKYNQESPRISSLMKTRTFSLPHILEQ